MNYYETCALINDVFYYFKNSYLYFNKNEFLTANHRCN